MNYITPQTHGLKYVQATISNTALALTDIAGITAGLLDMAKMVKITVRVGAINYTHTASETPTIGTGVSDGTGHHLVNLGELQLAGKQNLTDLKLIRSAATNAVVDITLWG